MISNRAKPLVPSTQSAISQHYAFSPGLLVADLVYMSGQIGTAEDGRALSDPEAQFVAAFEHMKEILDLAGCGLEDVVELTSFHTNFDHFELFTSVKDRYLLGPVFPCWTAVGAELALPGALVEVKCTAHRKPRA